MCWTALGPSNPCLKMNQYMNTNMMGQNISENKADHLALDTKLYTEIEVRFYAKY